MLPSTARVEAKVSFAGTTKQRFRTYHISSVVSRLKGTNPSKDWRLSVNLSDSGVLTISIRQQRRFVKGTYAVKATKLDEWVLYVDTNPSDSE